MLGQITLLNEVQVEWNGNCFLLLIDKTNNDIEGWLAYCYYLLAPTHYINFRGIFRHKIISIIDAIR